MRTEVVVELRLLPLFREDSLAGAEGLRGGDSIPGGARGADPIETDLYPGHADDRALVEDFLRRGDAGEPAVARFDRDFGPGIGSAV